MPITTPRPRFAGHRGGLALLVGVLTLTAAGAAVLPSPRLARAAPATTTSDLNLRAGPSTGDPILLTMPPGAVVELTGQEANGFLGATYNGVTGWAFAAYLRSTGAPAPDPDPSPSPGPSGGTATATTDLNLRSGPSTADPVVLTMPTGSTVTLTGESANGFLGVNYNGTSGWAFAAYLGTGGTPPVPPSPPPAELPPSPAPTTPPDAGPSGAAYTTSVLNLRTGPGPDFPILTTMPAGASVTRGGAVQNGFAQVVFFGQEGWASTTYLREGTAPTLPAPSPDPSPAPPPSPGDDDPTTDQIIQIIYDAADRYGQPREDMLRVARCESNLIPTAVNYAGSSYGLFQFIRSTWATTPYAEYDIFDPWASANAAGWMWSVGRRGEWVCQ